MTFDRVTAHSQTRIELDGHSALVDAGIAPLILAAWRRGFQTISSCECGPGTSHAYVVFPTRKTALAFQQLIGRGNLITPTAEEARGDATMFLFPEATIVGFPTEQIPAALARLEDA